MSENKFISPVTKFIREEFIPVDEWVPREDQKIFRQVKGAMVLPLCQYCGSTDPNFDNFILSTKRCYNSDDVRNHFEQYLNYFENFYDKDKELFMVYYKLKYLIDCEPSYTEEAFINDITRYILTSDIRYKTMIMNEQNYMLNLEYKNKKNPGLQYSDKHGKLLMLCSLQMVTIIPLLTHFLHKKKIKRIKWFLLSVYDIILNLYAGEVNLYNKLYETSITNIDKSRDNHSVLWNMQNIRSRNTTTHAIDTVNNMILQIMPKYVYNMNIIPFNYKSVLSNIKYKVTHISYEYSFISLSSSLRDEDNNSEFDRFESSLTKADESLYIQNTVNCEQTIKSIENLYGPFDPNEIEFYINELSKDDKLIINSFQKELIFNLFYRYFGDPVSIKAINIEDYVKLIIAARKILESSGMVVLPYIISSNVTTVSRKSVNKKELTKIESSPNFKFIKEKYDNDKIIKLILSYIATILSSKFTIISYFDDDINGQVIDMIPEFICEEILLYITMI